jgi:hypothetical protein
MVLIPKGCGLPTGPVLVANKYHKLFCFLSISPGAVMSELISFLTISPGGADSLTCEYEYTVRTKCQEWLVPYSQLLVGFKQNNYPNTCDTFSKSSFEQQASYKLLLNCTGSLSYLPRHSSYAFLSSLSYCGSITVSLY